MKRAVLAGVVAALLIGGFHFATTSGAATSGAVQGAAVETLARAPGQSGSVAPAVSAAAVVQRDAEAGPLGGVQPPPRRPAGVTPQAQARAKALREAIVAKHDRPEASGEGDDASRSYGPGDVTNRGGLPDEVMRAVNEQLMPLVDECIDLARGRQPELTGMLALSVHAVGDPDLGSVIDAVEAGARNQVLELELLECVRESAWTLTLPPLEETGAHAFELTLEVGDEAAN